MHQYFDSDGSGTSPNCLSDTIGVERLATATQWLRANGKIGVIGEFSAGPNAQCKATVEEFMEFLNVNSDVWKGALWWAAGPWWKDDPFNFEPPNGQGYRYYNTLFKSYA